MISTVRQCFQQCLDGIEFARQGRSTESAMAFHDAIETYPGSVSAHLCLAMYLQASKQYQQAMNQFDIAIQLALHHSFMSSRLFHCRAILHQEMSNTSTAISDLDLAIQYDSCFPEAMLLRGKLLLESRDYLAAINDFEAVLQIDANMKGATAARAEALDKLQRQQTCADHCQSLLQRHLTEFPTRRKQQRKIGRHSVKRRPFSPKNC